MTVRNRWHSRIMARVAQVLNNWLDQQPDPRGSVLCGEAGCRLRRNPDSTVGIDVVYIGPELAASAIRYVPPLPGRRLVEMLRIVDLRLIASGHVHQRRDFSFGHTRHIWAPSAGFIISDARQDRIGIKEVGIVEYRFQPDSFEVRHVKAPGQTDVDLDELLKS